MLGIVNYSDSDDDDDDDDDQENGTKLVEDNGTGSCESLKSDIIDNDILTRNDKSTLKGNGENKMANNETDSENGSDSDVEDHFSKSADLPLPDIFRTHSSVHNKCGKKRKSRGGDHAGRNRTFEHVDGNWPTYVYVSVQQTSSFQEQFHSLIKCLRQHFADELHAFPLNSCHVTVSRTVPIRHYWIEPMYEKLKLLLRGMKAFYFSFDSIRVYTNDDKTRTFVGLQIAHGYDRFTSIVEKTDQVYKDFELPEYYSEPSFHASIAWLLGDRKDEVDVYLGKSGQGDLEKEILYQNADSVCMKTGNQVHTIPLL